MSNQGPFDNDNNQFVVSHELLELFRWLFEHEQEHLKKLISRALRDGFHQQLQHKSEGYDTPEELQQSVVDFFALLETLLYELVNETEVQKVIQRNLLPALDHIDSTVCDDNIVAMSAAKVTSMLEDDPLQDPKTALCKELLKRWKPSKKLSTN
jgi:hypothetical protein